ncbi:MAG: tryptophan synthase subunit alpha [Frankiales bacterium]|nr:tryptophan synthase subunit alpha [Frankiales bacterium]
MSQLDALFASCRAEGRAALIGYLPAGFPAYDLAVEAMIAMVEEGVDAVEVGMPYTDPLMEGPVIQAAHERSLANGTRQADVLRTVEAVAAAGAPTLVMGYWNPVHRYGFRRWAQALKDAGGAGAITPDLIPEEAPEWLEACREFDLDPVFLVAPSSTDERIAVVGRTNRGFVYAAAVMGVTGARAEVGVGAQELVRRTRAQTDLPVAVGLGVSTAAQAAQVAAFADGVVVGSALVRALDTGGVDAVRRLSAQLADGVRSVVPA